MGDIAALNVFIVDDDYLCREMYHQHLRNLGFCNIYVFENGEDCVNKLGLLPAIIFCDYNMQPLNGLEVLQKTKKQNPGTYILLISGENDTRIANMALKYGAFDYIKKDEHVLDTISGAVNEIRNYEELLNGSGNKTRHLRLQ